MRLKYYFNNLMILFSKILFTSALHMLNFFDRKVSVKNYILQTKANKKLHFTSFYSEFRWHFFKSFPKLVFD